MAAEYEDDSPDGMDAYLAETYGPVPDEEFTGVNIRQEEADPDSSCLS